MPLRESLDSHTPRPSLCLILNGKAKSRSESAVPLLTCINSCCCTYPSVTPSWIRARKPVIWTRWSPGVWSCKVSNKPNPQVWPKVRPWQLQALSWHCHDISAPSINILPVTSTSLGKDKNSYLLISPDFALATYAMQGPLRQSQIQTVYIH